MKSSWMLSALLSCVVMHTVSALERHEVWWENCLGNTVSMETFTGWAGGVDAPSRQHMRVHVRKKEYTSILDVACGLCVDYLGLKKDNMNIRYQGLDITPKLVELGLKNNMPIARGSIEAIPFWDSSFDLVYARHILEHLSGYETALKESIRVAAKEVMVTFFIPPTGGPTRIVAQSYLGTKVHQDGFTLYHNVYNAKDLETYVKKNEKVDRVEWEGLGGETLMHIYMK